MNIFTIFITVLFIYATNGLATNLPFLDVSPTKHIGNDSVLSSDDQRSREQYVLITLLDLPEKKQSEKVKAFSKTKSVAITNLNLLKMPDSFKFLTNLKELDLSENSFSQFPPCVINFTDLTDLFMISNRISKIPHELCKLTQLTEVALSNNHLRELPLNIGNLINLVGLYLDNNSITSLPESFGNLISLRIFSMSENLLFKLPETFSKLTNLETLFLDKNHFRTFPDEITGLLSLKGLVLRENNTKSIPATIAQLTNLERLDLSFNELKNLPVELGYLTHLTQLYLNKNMLSSLPFSIGNLSELRELWLNHNALFDLPLSMATLTKLKKLKIAANRIKSPPEWVHELNIHTDLGPVIKKPMPSIAETEYILPRANDLRGYIFFREDPASTPPVITVAPEADRQTTTFESLIDTDLKGIVDLAEHQAPEVLAANVFHDAEPPLAKDTQAAESSLEQQLKASAPEPVQPTQTPPLISSGQTSDHEQMSSSSLKVESIFTFGQASKIISLWIFYIALRSLQ